MASHAEVDLSAVHAFLARSSSGDLEQIIQAARAIQQQRGDPVHEPKNRVKKKRGRSNSDNEPSMGEGHLKALNGFMAFRAYYAAMFVSAQQKNVSGIIKTLWKEDPNTAKWQIIAKAYSTIRDSVGRSAAPLTAFLNIACPSMGIIEPADYLNALGWVICDDGDKPYAVRRFTPDPAMLEGANRRATHSADDIVNLCQRAGYVSASDYSHNAFVQHTPNTAQMAMAVPPNTNIMVQPSPPSADINTHYSSAQATHSSAPTAPHSWNPDYASVTTQNSTAMHIGTEVALSTFDNASSLDPRQAVSSAPLASPTQSLAIPGAGYPNSTSMGTTAMPMADAQCADFDAGRRHLDEEARRFWDVGDWQAIDLAFIPYCDYDDVLDPESFDPRMAFDISGFNADEGAEFDEGPLSLIV